MENSSYYDTHFAILPAELLVEILRYVSLSDVWNFCDALKDVEHLLKEQALTRNINLKAWYDVNTNRIFSNINPENVKSLNLNYCHWILPGDLQSFVGKCANLETLLAFGTKLALSDQDIKSYKKTKINKLAVTIKSQTPVAKTAVLDRVTSLALEMNCDMSDVCTPEEFSRIFPSLQKVSLDNLSCPLTWICRWLQTYKSSGQFQELVYCFRFLNNYSDVVRRLPAATNLFFTSIRMKSTFQSVACFETVDVDVENDPDRFFKPYGRKVTKLLQSGAKTLETIQFEELNFFQPISLAWQNHNEKKALAFQQLLMSPNARNIEKLTLPTCFLNSENDSCRLKNFNNLRFLQLFHCFESPDLKDIHLQEYNSLADLTKLRYLSVAIPKSNDGEFLFDVLSKCSQLETLHIYNFPNFCDENITFKRHLCKGLEHSASLKELILEQYFFLCIDDLLSILIQSKQIKLQKLSLSCKYSGQSDEIHAEFLRLHHDPSNSCQTFINLKKYLQRKSYLEFFSVDLLCKYMSCNPQLTDCQFCIDALYGEQIALIKQHMSKFNTSYRNIHIGQRGFTISHESTYSRFNLMDGIDSF